MDRGNLWEMTQGDPSSPALETASSEDGRDDIEEMKSYVGLTAEDEAELAALQSAAHADMETLLDRFYGVIDAHAGARRVFRNPERQRASLRRSLAAWILTMLEGPYDQTYAEHRRAIGRAHVENKMPQRYMLTSMNVVRSWFVGVCAAQYSGDPERLVKAITAVDRILDIELAMMLATYRDDLLSRMQRQERLATLGELAAGIHHELKNPLAAVRTAAFALRERRAVRADARSRALLDRVDSNVDRATEIISDLLSFARLRNPEKSEIAVDRLVRGAASRITIPADCRLTLDLDPDLPPAVVDTPQVEQVLVNLLSNAFDACSGGGEVRISSRLQAGKLAIAVTDDGMGIAPADLQRIFEPLYSTKPEGVGLGLSLSQHLARANGARLLVKSTPNQGTSVTLLLDR